MELKERLRALRTRLGLTQEELAKRAQLERVEVVNLEGGRNQATSVRILKGIAMGFNLTLQDACDLVDGALDADEALRRIQAPKVPPRPRDVIPNRGIAAELALDDGVHPAAVKRVLEEAKSASNEARSALWWARRMEMCQLEMRQSEHQHPDESGPVRVRKRVG